MKTTNAKAQPSETPANPQQMTKIEMTKIEMTVRRPSTGRRSAKSKIALAPAQSVDTNVLVTDDDDNVPDIEYAPPAPIELPDPPMEFGYDQTFPQFEGMNMMRGYGEVYGSPKDEHGKSIRVKEEEERWASFEREVNQKILKSVADTMDSRKQDEELERQVDAMIAAGPKKKSIQGSKVDTLKARSAVAALSRPQLPAAATKQTASSMQKKRKTTFVVLGSKSAPKPTDPPLMRHTAAVALSRNTIGRPKAKKAPSIIPKNEQRSTVSSKPKLPTKIDQSQIHPETFVELYGQPPVESDMWFRLREHQLLADRLEGDEQHDLADDLFETNFFPTGGEDDELFQLAMPD